MKILITGGAGFIGSHLTERLLSSQDNEIYVLDDLSTGDFKNIEQFTQNSRFHYTIKSILNKQVVEELIKDCDIVYHLAAAVGVKLVVQQPSKTIETNILGSQIVLKNCARYHKKVLLISTSEVYGKGLSFNEEDDCVIGPSNKKRWSYAASKAMEEYLAFAYYYEKQLPMIIVRLFNTIGLRQTDRYGMVAPAFVKQALANKTLTVYGDGKQTRTFLAIDDAVDAFTALMGHPHATGEVFNIGGEQEISIDNLAHLIIKLSKSSSSIDHIPYLEAYGEAFEDMPRRVPDISKVKKVMGFKPKVSLEEMLQKIITFHRSK